MWKKRLEEIKNKYGRDFYVQKFLKFPHEWLIYGSEHYNEFIKKEKTVNHREIMNDEIVVDLDIDKKNITRQQAREKIKEAALSIQTKLVRYGFSFEFWYSGGDGIHIQIYFPELIPMEKEKRDDIKKEFLKWIGYNYLNSSEDKAHVCVVNKTLIQIEHAVHRKGGIKTLDKSLSNNLNIINKIPKIIYDKAEKKHEEMKQLYNAKKDEKEPFWVKIFESGFAKLEQDGGYLSSWCLFSYYCRTMPHDEAEKKIIQWNKNNKYVKGITTKEWLKRLASAKKSNKIPYKRAVELLEELGYDLKQEVKK